MYDYVLTYLLSINMTIIVIVYIMCICARVFLQGCSLLDIDDRDERKNHFIVHLEISRERPGSSCHGSSFNHIICDVYLLELSSVVCHACSEHLRQCMASGWVHWGDRSKLFGENISRIVLPSCGTFPH